MKLNEGILKQFVSGDTMYFDRKGILGINAKPTARLMIWANDRPAISDRSNGIWRRLLYLPFRVAIPDAEQDRQLAEKLRAEMPGILNWALAGRQRLHSQGSSPSLPCQMQ
jgi:putative DNA primase/helicase